MNGTPLVIDEEVRSQIKACAELAEANPVDMTTLEARFKDPVKREHHRAQMQRQTIFIPLNFEVTFSIEHGQPFGPSRHMSMSVGRLDRVPNPIAFWMIAKEFGFWGDMEKDLAAIWDEPLSDGRKAINALQPVVKPA